MEADSHLAESERETGAAAADDDRLEELLARYIDRLNRGEILDRERLEAEEPALAAELWKHLEIFSGMNDPQRGAALPDRLGDYEVRRQIGRGGMGVVYEAWQDSMARRVALKVLPAALATDSKALARFLREAQVAGKLEHPHVVAVYGLGVENGVPHFAMEYVDGETLAQALARLRSEAPGETLPARTPFGPAQKSETYVRAATAFAGVAEGLHEAHALGVIHRDLKPSNLILDERSTSEGDARLRVLDFGLARLEGEASLTLSRDFVGTPRYMSPEQARGAKKDLDGRSDVYSLGATLYEVLVGRPPFDSESVEQTLSLITSGEVPGLRARNPHVSQDLETIVLKCLRKHPGERYATAEAFAQDLRRFARGDAVEARPQPAWEKLAQRLWRHRVAALAFFVVLPIVLMVGVVLLAQKEREAVRLREAGEEELYVAQVNSAQEALSEGNFNRYARLLDRHVPQPGSTERRGWEWYYLDSQRRLERLSIPAHKGRMISLAFTRDGERIASGGDDGRARVWAVRTGEKLLEVEHGKRVTAVAWRRDDEQLVTGAAGDGLVRFWDGASGEPREAFPVVGGEASSDEHDVVGLAEAPHDTRWAAAWRRRGAEGASQVVIWGDRGVRERLALPEARYGIVALAWSPDGTRLATAAAETPFVVWDAETGREITRWFHDWTYYPRVAWSPAGAHLAWSRGQRSFWILESTGWTELDSVAASGPGVRALVWSEAGDLLATGASNGLVELWDFPAVTRRAAFHAHGTPVTTLAWNASGGLASGAASGTVKLWDPSRPAGAAIRPGNGHVAFSPDGERIVTQDDNYGTVIVVELASGAVLRTLDARGGGKTFTIAAKFSPDGRLVAATTYESRLWVWEWRSGQELLRTPVTESLSFAGFHPDGHLLAAADQVWDSRTWKVVATLPGLAVDWSPDGSMLACVVSVPGPDDLAILRTDDWTELRRWPDAPYGQKAFAWHPNGGRVAIGGGDGRLGVRERESGDTVFTTRGHAGGVKNFAWSPDGRRLASASKDGTVKLWDATSGADLLTLRFPAREARTLEGVHWVAWSPDGKRLVAADGYDVVLWEAPGFPNSTGR